jgi:hypothetical protein
VSRSSSTREPVAQPPRSASSPVLHPLPLPSPRPADLEAQDPPAGVADAWTAPRCVSVPFLQSLRFPLYDCFLPNFISSELIDCFCQFNRQGRCYICHQFASGILPR